MVQSHTSTPPSEIVLLPEADQWAIDLQAPATERSINTRKQLKIPTDRPVVASGHQPIFFHPGIVSKLIALDHHSKKIGAAAVWVVPDQDVVDAGLIRIPDHSGAYVSVQEIDIGGGSNQLSPAMALSPIQADQNLPSELESVGSWLSGYQHESSLARQFASATIGMLCEQLDLEEPTLVYSSDLLQTDAGSSLLDAMLEDPCRAIRSYNACVERFAHAGVRRLAMDDDQVELPLWRIEGRSRVPVLCDPSGTLEFDRSDLVPSGLLMTAIMRLAVCDLFIHGTGGYEYDQITEAWLDDWQGQSFAQITAVSATMRLDIPHPETALDPDEMVWKAHAAHHNPALLGDHSTAAQKSALLAQIKESKSKGDQARSAKLFVQLHQLLAQWRLDHADELGQLKTASDNAHHARQAMKVVQDRTWAFPLYSDVQMQSLKTQIIQALEGQG